MRNETAAYWFLVKRAVGFNDIVSAPGHSVEQHRKCMDGELAEHTEILNVVLMIRAKPAAT